MGSFVEQRGIDPGGRFKWVGRLLKGAIGWVGAGLFFYIATGVDAGRYGPLVFGGVVASVALTFAVRLVLALIPVSKAAESRVGDRVIWRVSRERRLDALVMIIAMAAFLALTGMALNDLIAARDWGRSAAAAAYVLMIAWGLVMLLVKGLRAPVVFTLDRAGLEIPDVIDGRLPWTEMTLVETDNEIGSEAVRLWVRPECLRRFRDGAQVTPDGAVVLHLSTAAVKASYFLEQVAERAPDIEIRQAPPRWTGALPTTQDT